jgi:2-polyprenyl-6-methoxyphenol hydroxylase-like FAD-dependent oxidoreductase
MARKLCIVGGGPAGMMAGYLFARAGVDTLVLEKHGDFLRDFRGDTIHPSTLELFAEIGLLSGLLERPHGKLRTMSAVINRRSFRIADFSHLPVRSRFIAMMPQWELLDFLAGEARKLPNFELRMGTEATGLIVENNRALGVTTNRGDVRADLTIAADGRDSVLREGARLKRHDLGAAIDVFWFRIPKAESPDNRSTAYLGAGEMLVTIDRGDYFQCGRMIAQGSADRVRGLGLQRFRSDIGKIAPILAGWLDGIDDWEKVQLLSGSLDRLGRWWRPGFLAIGDVAHAMSPIGGVGINLAIQDAVAAANILAVPLAEGRDVTPLLQRVQARRRFPVRVTQSIQRMIHDRVIGAVFRSDKLRPSLLLRLVNAVPLLQRIPARIIGLGVRREKVRSPEA